MACRSPLSGLPVDIGQLDTMTFTVVISVLTTVARVASWLPATRSARADAVDALNSE